jgi:hypothetical protein
LQLKYWIAGCYFKEKTLTSLSIINPSTLISESVVFDLMFLESQSLAKRPMILQFSFPKTMPPNFWVESIFSINMQSNLSYVNKRTIN